MVFEWKDKVVIITGAADGIGALVVRYLMDENVKHVAIFDINESRGVALEDELNDKEGPTVKFYKCDVTNHDLLFTCFNSVKESMGYVDVVINNAGIMNDRLYKKEIDLNLNTAITLTIKAQELMRKDLGGRGGTILNLSSMAGLTQTYVMPVYWATKAAIIQFGSCIGHPITYERTGVRVLTVCPGGTRTALIKNVGSYDEVLEADLTDRLAQFPMQSVENAARGIIDAFKEGESGSTWLVANERPAEDITGNVRKAYAILAEPVFR